MAWAALDLAFASVLLVQIQQNAADTPSTVWVASGLAVAIIAGAALALIGLLFVSRSPTAGRGMAILGAAVVGGTSLILLPWMWFVGIAMALPLAIIGVVRARHVLEAGRQQPA